jgi:drug/metabolite transporter (DMT)-like permease
MINYLLFGLLAIFWGGSFVAIKEVLTTLPSFTGAFYRIFFSFLFLIIIYIRSLKFPQGFWGKELFHISICGLFSIAIPFSLLFLGEVHISPSMAGVLNGTVPFWTLIVGIIFFNTGPDTTKSQVLGLVVGFIGIVFIFAPKLAFSGDSKEILGLVLVTVMAWSYSVGINLNKKIMGQVSIIPRHLNLIVQQFVSVVFLAVVVFIVDGVPDLALLNSPNILGSTLYLAFFSTCIGYIIFYRLIHEIGAVKASTVTFFVPPIALTLDSLIYGRELTSFELIGAGIILLSMVLLRAKKS